VHVLFEMQTGRNSCNNSYFLSLSLSLLGCISNINVDIYSHRPMDLVVAVSILPEGFGGGARGVILFKG